MSLRPIEIDPLTVKSKSGNSSLAASLAEYMDAPASFIRYTSIAESLGNMLLINCSVSLPAVPLPIAMASISCLRMRLSMR